MQTLRFLLFLFLIGVYLINVYVISHIIKTRVGLLKGKTDVARNNRLYHSYTRVPYAKPPIGELRFQPPVAAGEWNGMLDATQMAPRCPQIPENEITFDGVEDCLYLNIHTPKDAKPGSDYPVVFYIFGGVFKFGQIRNMGPQNFMNKDIVMVFVSYRLGVLGFLSTGDSVVSGNMGLKDQTLALRWTKENIYEFGGDPNRVTIHGDSSGAICIHLHTLSPLSKDYFHRAIMQSGLGVSPHIFPDKDVAVGMTKALCERLNCSVASSASMFDCLNNRTAEELVVAAETLQIWHTPDAIFQPTVEDDVEGSFLTKHPLQAPYQSNKKAWLLGITNKEGAYDVTGPEGPINAANIIEKASSLYLPVATSLIWNTKPNHVKYIEQILKTHFFGEETRGPFADNALVEMLTGLFYGYPLLEVVEKYKGLKYVYLFNYRGGFSYQKSSVYRGIGHGDELALLFVNNAYKGVTEKDLEFGDEIITRWVNFAYTGDPNNPFAINESVFAAWKPVFSKRLEYLTIRPSGMMEADHLVSRFGFWKRIPIFGKYLR